MYGGSHIASPFCYKTKPYEFRFSRAPSGLASKQLLSLIGLGFSRGQQSRYVGTYNHSRAALGSSKKYCDRIATQLCSSSRGLLQLHKSSSYTSNCRLTRAAIALSTTGRAQENLVYTKHRSRYTSSNSTHELAKPRRLLRRPGNLALHLPDKTITGPRDSFNVTRVTRQEYQ